ncbi:ATP-binding protein [Paenarthrobacter ilicis]|uniref:ATP-binding protein n=1 Tax=Paenarthrobacter ilicis TaxID=43665 RepID=UPI003008FA50
MLPDPWLDEDTVTAGLRITNPGSQGQLLSLILSSAASPLTNGIVVGGDHGSGKSHLLLAIKAGLADTMDVRLFTGTPELKTTSYGALGSMTGQGSDAGHGSFPDKGSFPDHGTDAAVSRSLQVLRALTTSLGPAPHLYTPLGARRRPKRQVEPSRPPLVLLVDDIQYLDPASLAVLLQLIPGFGATLVATADSNKPLPTDLYELWEDGFLDQYLMPPFTFGDAHRLCEEVLGGRVQQRASSLLAAVSGFNVGLLRRALDDARHAGLLVLKEGFWTINLRVRCGWPGVVAYVRADNAELAAEERQALELVALAEPVPLDAVERHFGPAAVQALLGRQLVRLLPGQPPLLRSSSWLRGEATRLSVPGSRSLALRLGLEEPAPSTEAAPRMLPWMMWTLDCGLPLSDELLLAAAPAADRPTTAELAIRAAAAVSGPEHRDEARLLRARALVAEGEVREAELELQSLAQSTSDAVRIDAAHRLMALQLLGATPGAAREAVMSGDSSGPFEELMRSVMEAEHLLLAGEVTEALDRSAAALAAVEAHPDLDMLRPAVLLRHAVCLRYNLAWDRLDALLEGPAPYALPATMAMCQEVARGYALVSQGFARAARATLEPVLAELSDAGLPPVRALAGALLAYSEALCGNPQGALELVEQTASTMGAEDDDRDGFLSSVASVFLAAAQDMATAHPGRLLLAADRFRAAHAPALEAEALSLMTLEPHSMALDDLMFERRLAGVGTSIHGAAGASWATFAGALLSDDPRGLESAGRSLAAERQFSHAAVCFARAAKGYEARTRSAASRRTRALVERLFSAFDSGTVPPLGWVPGRAGN